MEPARNCWLEEKDEYDKAREMVEGVISRRFQRQGPDIANQVRILKSRDLVAKPSATSTTTSRTSSSAGCAPYPSEG